MIQQSARRVPSQESGRTSPEAQSSAFKGPAIESPTYRARPPERAHPNLMWMSQTNVQIARTCASPGAVGSRANAHTGTVRACVCSGLGRQACVVGAQKRTYVRVQLDDTPRRATPVLSLGCTASRKNGQMDARGAWLGVAHRSPEADVEGAAGATAVRTAWHLYATDYAIYCATGPSRFYFRRNAVHPGSWGHQFKSKSYCSTKYITG
ncbi:hypothetical protein C8Q77DRAFT_584185 [Trametes polyzona]|nr:hypothetical protein C8Q77DRAFT_584185 [Trametes polyzona]